MSLHNVSDLPVVRYLKSDLDTHVVWHQHQMLVIIFSTTKHKDMHTHLMYSYNITVSPIK